MLFDATYKGAVMELYNGVIYTLRDDGNFAAAYAYQDMMSRVTLTGYHQTSLRGNDHYQTTDGGWIYLPDGWVQVGTVSVNQYSQAQAQALVDRIIKNNDAVLFNNLICSRYANKLTADQRAEVRELQRRVQARNEALQAGGLTTNVRTGVQPGYAELAPYLDSLMSGESIGVATWVVVVIVATVVAATATAAYFAYKEIADESANDVKYSQELTRTLTEKLTEEEYQQLLDETKGIVTKARIKQAIGSYSKILIGAGLLVGGFLLYRVLKKWI